MSQPETRLQTRIVTALSRDPRVSFAVRQRLVGRSGWPDVYAIIRPCRPMHLEVKMPKGKRKKLQGHTLKALASAGAITGTVESVAEALAVLDSAMPHTSPPQTPESDG